MGGGERAQTPLPGFVLGDRVGENTLGIWDVGVVTNGNDRKRIIGSARTQDAAKQEIKAAFMHRNS